MPRSRLVLALTALLAASAGVMAGCRAEGRDTGAGEDAPVRVVATTMQVEDIVRQVGGDRVRVTGLLESGTDPHGYEPRPSDAAAVVEADLVASHGAGLDDWLGDLLDQADAEAARSEASRGVPLRPTEEEGLAGDPHIWHDPQLAARMVDNVAEGLVRADPPGRDGYRRKARAYKRRLARMAREIRRLFAPVPRERRDLVTSHDAFGYFGRAYGVNVVGSVLPAVTVESEPSARELRSLIEEVRASGVRTIFTERGLDPRLERRVAEEAGATVSSELYADTLGPPGSGASTLIEAELANARAMRSAWRAR